MKKLPFTPLRYSKEFIEYFSPELNLFLGRNVLEEQILSTDFKQNVKIECWDGTAMEFKDAFFVLKTDKPYPEKTKKSYTFKQTYKIDNSLFAIFTEHHGYFMFYKDNIKSIKMTKKKIIINNT